MAKKTVVFEQLKDLHVKNIVLFVDSGKIYFDADHTEQVKEVELQELFSKGLLVVKTSDGVFNKVVAVDANKAYAVSASTTAAVVEYAAVAAEANAPKAKKSATK